MEVWWVSTIEAPLERLGSHRHQQFVFSPVSPWGWRHGFWGAWLNGVLSSRTPNAKKDSVSPKELRSKAATIQQLGQLKAFLWLEMGENSLRCYRLNSLPACWHKGTERCLAVLLRLGPSTAVSSVWCFKRLAPLSRTSLTCYILLP